jgi:hypothetical protein
MKTENIESKQLHFPQSWDEVRFDQYIKYLRKIKALNYSPSRLRFMEAINGDGSQEVFDTIPELIMNLDFVHIPPALNEPKKIDLEMFTLDIPRPIKFHCREQIDDVNEYLEQLYGADGFIMMESGALFCALYCQPLINPNYSKEDALNLVYKILKAPVTQVMDLYGFIMIHLIKNNCFNIATHLN